MKKCFLAFLLLPNLLSAQLTRQDSTWLPVSFFVGSWKGAGEGEVEPGKELYEGTYQYILNKKFIEIKSKATYHPTEKNHKGEVREDIGYISYDKGRKLFILRQFHVEGFINQYKLDSISSDGKTIVFISEAIENFPAGWKAKETYQLLKDDEFVETFELAAPNKNFKVYTNTVFKRTKQ